MSSPHPLKLSRPRSASYAIADVVALAERGALRVPRFQRPFVWDARDVRLLFESIWRGFPIGTLLLWSRPSPAETVSFGPLEIDAPAMEDALWVVDGQQRVTSLVAALGGARARRSEGNGTLFNVHFDLRTAVFVHGGRRQPPAWWLPLPVALESRTLLSWLRAHGEELTPEDLDLADAVAGALRDYKVAAYVVEEQDESVLRDIFDRVNSAGKPITRAQVFHALFGGDTPQASAEAVAAALKRKRFGSLDSQRIVQSLLAIRGGDVGRDFHNEFSKNETTGNEDDKERWFDETETALGRVIDFLQRQGVPHLQLVPSTLPIPALAAFFHLHPDPHPWNERLLALWLWRGWVHGYGRSGQTPALRQTVRAVHSKKGDPASAPPEYEAVLALVKSVADEAPTVMTDGPFRTDAVNGRLALLAMASLEPLRASGERIDLAAEFENHGLKAVTELVVGHRSQLAARGLWPIEDSPPLGTEPEVVLRTHGIDASAADALRRGDVAAFLAHRSATLEVLVARLLAVRVDQGALLRPPLSDLIVPEELDAEGGDGDRSLIVGASAARDARHVQR